MGSALFCQVCGGSLRSAGSRCANGCCRACHQRYCSASDHTLNIDQARRQKTADLLAAMASGRQCLEPKPESG